MDNLNAIEILNKKDSIFLDKKNGTIVNYYLFEEFEIHENTLLSNSVQDWHRHDKIEEVIFITSGKFIVEIKEKNEKESIVVHTGDVIRMKKSIHRICNSFPEDCKFIVFRFVPEGVDKSEIIKNDKVSITHI